MKTCTNCKLTKSLEEFQKRTRNKDGRTNLCKLCKRDYDNNHYKNNPERKDYIRKNSQKRIDENRIWILDYLNQNPCVDCSESDVIVLEFDHRDNKITEICRMVQNNSLSSLKLEVLKCDVRCANCHRRKTAKDFGYWRTQALLV